MNENIFVHDTGYGLIQKSVMRNKNLSIEAKAIYGYIASFAGTSMKAYPSVELICAELNISEKRFRKYRKELVELGYLTIERKRLEKGFSKNIYNLHSVPGQFVSLQNVPLQNVSLQNVGTNNNSIKNNSIKNNSVKNNNHHHYIENNNIYSSADDVSTNTLKSGGGSNPFTFFQENGFGVINGYIAQDIDEWRKDFKEHGDDMLVIAMKIAVDNNKATWSYTKSILKRWLNANITTPNDVKADKKANETKKKYKDPDKMTHEERKIAMQDPAYWD